MCRVRRRVLTNDGVLDEQQQQHAVDSAHTLQRNADDVDSDEVELVKFHFDSNTLFINKPHVDSVTFKVKHTAPRSAAHDVSLQLLRVVCVCVCGL
jgi:hypothetical protein